MARITLTTESGTTHSLELEQDHYSIGRAEDCDLSIDDPSLSGHHATIEHVDGEWMLSDQDSTNGTKVNGEAIQGNRILRHDDAVAFADVAGFFANLTDVSRTKQIRSKEQRAADKAAAADRSHAPVAAQQNDPNTSLAWRLVTLLGLSTFLLGIALAIALIVLMNLSKQLG